MELNEKVNNVELVKHKFITHVSCQNLNLKQKFTVFLLIHSLLCFVFLSNQS